MRNTACQGSRSPSHRGTTSRSHPRDSAILNPSENGHRGVQTRHVAACLNKPPIERLTKTLSARGRVAHGDNTQSIDLDRFATMQVELEEMKARMDAKEQEQHDLLQDEVNDTSQCCDPSKGKSLERPARSVSKHTHNQMGKLGMGNARDKAA